MARPLTVTAQGDAQVDTSVSKSGGASLQLDGTSDYLQVDQPNGELNTTGAWTIEMWVYVTNNTNRDNALVSSRIAGDTYDFVLSLEFRAGATDDRIKFSTVDKSAGPGLFVTGSVEELNANLAVTTWHHIAVTSNGSGTLRIWVNGSNTQTATSQPYYDLKSLSSSTNNDVLIGEDNIIGGVAEAFLHIDELRISNIERYTVGFTPAARHVPDANTLLLLHMDGADASTTFEDDIGEQGSATLTATAALSASGGVQPGGKSNLQVIATVDVDAVVKPPVTGDAVLALFGEITALANPNPSIVSIDDDFQYTWDETDDWSRISWLDRWFQGYRFPTITANLEADGINLVIAEADLSVETALTVEGLSLERADINISAEFTQTATAEMTRNATADLESQFTLASQSQVDVDGKADLDLSTEITTTGRILKLVDILIDPFADLSVSGEVTANAQATLESQFEIESASTVLKSATIDLIVTAEITAIPTLSVGGASDLAIETALSAQAQRLKRAQASLESEFSLISGAILTVVAEADLESSFTVTASAENLNISAALLAFEAELTSGSSVTLEAACVISDLMNFSVSAENFVRASASLTSEFTITADVFNFVNASATLDSETDLDADAVMTVAGRSTLDAFASQLTVGERLPGGSANLQMRFDFVSEGDLVLFDSEFVIHVLPETRSLAVEGETRQYKILPEDRSQAVLGETNTYRILPESRILTLEDQGA